VLKVVLKVADGNSFSLLFYLSRLNVESPLSFVPWNRNNDKLKLANLDAK